MSAIFGIYNFCGQPLDREDLQRMQVSLTYRGPDASRVWHGAHVGLGHRAFQITTGLFEEMLTGT